MKRETRRRRGGLKIGLGSNGEAYVKPDEIERLIPKGCEWKDGYVMKVFESKKDARDEWMYTDILRTRNIQGILYPESWCTLKNDKIALFSPFGGETIHEFFYSKGPLVTNEDYKAAANNRASGTIVRNREHLDKVVDALRRLQEHVNIMNENGIYHNDIHTGNIVYDGQNARLIDFGEITEDGKNEVVSIEDIIHKLNQSGGLRKRVVASRRRTRKRRSCR